MGYAWKWLSRRSDTPGLFGKIAISAFVLVQCLDGILTYRGVSAWGLGVEANSLIGWLMSVMGVGLGLVAVKLAAIGFGALLYWKGTHNVMALLTVFYLVFAVTPWLYLFLTL